MDREKLNFVWWYYFWLLLALTAINPIFLDSPKDWFHWALSIPALCGLWGYLRRRPLGHRYVWVGYFGYRVIEAVYGWFFGPSLGIAPGFRLGFAVIFVVVAALIVPLYIALWRYAFRSPSIWRHVASAA